MHIRRIKSIITVGTITIASIAVVAIGMLYRKASRQPVRDLQEIRQEGVLRITTDLNPTSYEWTDNHAEGFDYELAKLLSRRSNLRVEIYPEPNINNCLDGLLTHKYDIIGRQLPITTDYPDAYAYANPILLNKQVLVQRKAQYNQGRLPIRNQLNLAHKNLHLVAGTPTAGRIDNLSREIGDPIYITQNEIFNTKQLVALVAKGEIEFAVCDYATARKLQNDFPEIDIATDLSFSQFHSWVVRHQSSELLDSLNYWLEDIKQSAEFERILDEYYPNNLHKIKNK